MLTELKTAVNQLGNLSGLLLHLAQEDLFCQWHQCLVFKYRGLLVVNLEDLKDDNVLPDEVVKMFFFEKSIKGLRWYSWYLRYLLQWSWVFCCCIEDLEDIHFWNFAAQTCFQVIGGGTTKRFESVSISISKSIEYVFYMFLPKASLSGDMFFIFHFSCFPITSLDFVFFFVTS